MLAITTLSIRPSVSSRIPTQYGSFLIKAYPYQEEGSPNLALLTEDLEVNKPVFVRIHSECLTGDVFGSAKCDCGEQLDYAMKWMQEYGGVVLYLRQEGRGIGLVNKLKAYNLQDEGLDTREANLALGFHEDLRDYTSAIAILEDLGISQIRLLTNNPEKLQAFDDSPITVVDRVPIEMPPKTENLGYLRTKKKDMGHLLTSEVL